MLFSTPQRSYLVTTLLLLRATALSATPTSTALPSSVQSLIPDCALDCASSFIQNGFPTCTSSGDIECLCSRYTAEGLTLGEGLLGCVASSCTGAPSSDGSEFGVCNGQNNAVAATHTVITVTAAKPTATVASSSGSSQVAVAQVTPSKDHSSQNKPSKTTLRTTTKPTQRTTRHPSPKSTKTSSKLEPTATQDASSTQSSAAAATKAAGNKSGLTTGQIVGISVAAVGVVVLATGIVILLACLRRRNKTAKDPEWTPRLQPSGGMGNEKAQFQLIQPPFPPPKDRLKDPRGAMGGVGVAPVQIAHPPRPAPQRRSQAPAPVSGFFGPNQSQIGLALSPEKGEDVASPSSISSRRTMSKLLPDKPDFVALPNPRNNRPESAMTQMTMFEEDRRATMAPPYELPGSHPGHDSSVQFPMPPHYGNPQAGRDRARQPSLSLDIPARSSRYIPPRLPLPIAKPTPPPIPTPPTATTFLSSATLSPNPPLSGTTSPGYGIDSYYISPENILGTPELYGTEFPTPKMETPKPEPRRSAGTMKAAAAASRTASRSASTRSTARDSASSMTSFESADSDDPTPEDEDKQLSPVAESPISNLRYPKVPRASNQAVPRSPRSPGQSQPYPTLLAKRRGDNKAHDLEKRLWITQSNVTSIKSGSSNYSVGSGSLQRTGQSHVKSGSDGSAGGFIHQQIVFDSSGRTHRRSVTHHGGIRPQEVPLPGQGAEMALKSPLWAPKLTPTRRGDDLFLSVG